MTCRIALLSVLIGCLLGGCANDPASRAVRERRVEILRRYKQELLAGEPVPKEVHMIGWGEADLVAVWAERLSRELADGELTRELARRTAEIKEDDRLYALAETIDEREARLAVRQRLIELHQELLALRAAAAKQQPPAPGAEYGLEPARLMREIERLSRAQASAEYNRRRAEEYARCKRALRAVLELERADRKRR